MKVIYNVFIVSLVWLLFIFQNGNAAIVIDEFTRMGPNPAIGCSSCRITYYVKVTDTAIIGNFSFPQVIAPLSLFNATVVQIPPQSAILRMVIDFPPNQTYYNIPIVVKGLTVYIMEYFTCNYMPSTVSVAISTLPQTRLMSVGMERTFTLKENLINLTYTDGYPNGVSCFPDNPWYYCNAYDVYVEGDHIFYTVYISLDLDNIEKVTNFTIQDDINAMVTIDYVIKSYQVTINFPSPYQFIQDNYGARAIKYYPITSTSNYLRLGYYPQVVYEFNMSNPISDLLPRSGRIYQVLGNGQNATYLSDFGSGYSNVTFYDIKDKPVEWYNHLITFYGDSTSLLNTQAYLTYNNGPQLYIEVSTIAVIYYKTIINSIALPPYPFGYSILNNETRPSYQYTLQAYRTELNYQLHIDSLANQYFSIGLDIVPVTDTTPPILYSVQLYNLVDIAFYVLTVSDNSGLDTYRFEFSGTFQEGHASLTLGEGDVKSGTYIYGFTNKMVSTSGSQPSDSILLALKDLQGNSIIYDGIYYNNYESIPLPQLIPISKLDAWNFTMIQFIPNNIDTSHGPVNVSMLFNLTTFDVNYTPFIIIALGDNWIKQNQAIIGYSEWDYTDKVYRFDFTVPQRMANSSLDYTIDFEWGSTQLAGYFGDSAALRVWSSFTDMMPPIALSLTAFPSVQITSYGNVPTFGFEITVQDEPNGLKGGNFSIVSNVDGKPYTFQFNSTYRISGNQYVGTYRFPITIQQCRTSQEFRVSEINLWDNAGISSRDSPDTTQISPLYRILYDTAQTVINLTCVNMGSDYVKPTITNFIVSPSSIDIGSLNRTVTFSLTVFDGESGLSPRHDPVVYLSQYKGDMVLDVTHYSKSIISNTTTTYTYRTVVPPMFGYGNITLSVYGIVDNQLNLNGYSTNQLMNSSLDFVIMTTCSTNQPIIISTSKVYQHGGDITIYGHGFGFSNTTLSLYVDYQDGNGFIQQGLVSLAVYKFTIAKVKSPITTSFINIRLERGSKSSNIFRIDITKYFKSILHKPPITTICPGTPLCNGNGNCTSSGCVCNDPWSGPDCSSKPIIIPTPTTNTTDPVIVIDTGNGTSSTTSSSTTGSTTGSQSNGGGVDLKTIISIYSIRELSISGSTVQEYFPTVWLFTNQSSGLMEGEFKYLYSTILNNTSTMFNVTIQWFINQSTIEFAGQQINIQPYTIKESLYLSPYPFQSSLNTLQIIFNTEISSKSSQCSGKQVSNSDHNDIQWIKLNIDDKSLYANFIKRGEIDGRSIAIKNSLLDSEFETGVTQSFVGINVPNYQSSVFLDPDFSHLLNFGGDNNGDGCSPSNEDSKKTSIGMIAGIVIGCVATVAIAIAIAMYYTRKTKLKRQSIQLQKKLGNANNAK